MRQGTCLSCFFFFLLRPHLPPCVCLIDGPTMAHDHISQHSLSQHHNLPPMLSFVCPQCGRRCKNFSGLTRHRNSAHKDDSRLAIPITELRRVYHPNLDGTYNPLHITLFLLSLKAGPVIAMEHSSPQVPHLKCQLQRRIMTGSLSNHGSHLNLRNFSTPKQNFLSERLTSSLNFGQQRLFCLATIHPS